LRIFGRLRLLMPRSTMANAVVLPAYSDRIVQDSHLIPFYPHIVAQAALNLRGTENTVIFNYRYYTSYLISSQSIHRIIFSDLRFQIRVVIF